MTSEHVRAGSGWLRLREPADAEARSGELVDILRSHLPDGPLEIHDLGGGTGSMARWLAPFLDGPQRWMLHDRDAELLQRASGLPAPRSRDGATVSVETRVDDITHLDAGELAAASLITASALLDMFSAEEVDRFVDTCAGAGCPVLVTLSVVGRVVLAPADPLDACVTEAFNAHQRRLSTSGRLLGPDAAAAAVEAFRCAGLEVLQRPSPWHLTSERTELAGAWFTGWMTAALEQEPSLAESAAPYARRRRAQLAAGNASVTVDHVDLLALPRSGPGGTTKAQGPVDSGPRPHAGLHRRGESGKTTRGETMRALRLESWKSSPVMREVPRPDAGPGQVLVQMGGAGACHSDLHLMDEFTDGALPWGPPFTLGHENAGWVYALGSGVRGLEPGQPVAVVGAWGCGTCPRCMAGLETYCDRPELTSAAGGGGGLGLDGGMAEYLLVPAARHVVPLPDGLRPADAAPLTDAALTPYHAVRRSSAKLVPGSVAVVIGVGGLGHLAVQILRATTGAVIVAVDARESARDLATRSGADLALAPGDSLVAQIREAGHGFGADVVLDMVGTDETLATAAAAARQLADITLVGLGGGTLPYSFFSVPYEVSVQTTYWGNRAELVEVLDLAARGLLRPEVTRFPLDEASQAYDRLRRGEIDGRAVIVAHEDYQP